MLSAKRLRHHFQQSGGSGQYTRPFDELPGEAQGLILARVDLAQAEEPALACYFDEARWVLLTNRRLCWSYGNGSKDAPLTEVRSVEIDLSHSPAKSKLELDTVNIEMKCGTRHQIQLENGRPYFGFLNALRIASA